MLKKIKSNIIFKKVFAYINEYKILKIIKYNKYIQKKLGIDIINYKFYQGKYIIYESKTKGKEYNNKDELIYEGEYLNGERNGIGKEYNYYGNLMYEGEYLNGKRNGKGKEYGYENKIIFEGEYLDGERNGKGKEYYYVNSCDQKLIFDGEYLKGKKWSGTVNEYKRNGFIFKGEYLDGSKNGELTKNIDNFGILQFNGVCLNGKKYVGKTKSYKNSHDYINGNETILNCDKYKDNQEIFRGEYKNGKPWNGVGYDNKINAKYELKNGTRIEYDENNNLIYEGEYFNRYRKGRGKEYKHDEIIFDGYYLNDKRWNGKGKEYDSKNNLIFDGEYVNGKKKGKYKEYNDEGKLIFEGECLYDFKYKGKEYNDKGILIFEGEYLKDKKWKGKVKEYYYNFYGLKILFEGELLNGKENRIGKEYYNDKLIFEGQYINDKRNGQGKEYNYKGDIIFEGEYFNNQRWNGKGIEHTYDYDDYEE